MWWFVSVGPLRIEAMGGRNASDKDCKKRRFIKLPYSIFDSANVCDIEGKRFLIRSKFLAMFRSKKNPELSRVFSFEHGLGQNMALYALPAYGNYTFDI